MSEYIKTQDAYDDSSLSFDMVPFLRQTDERVITEYASQVLSLIQAHNAQFPGSMYERPVDDIAELIYKDDAVMFVEGMNVVYFSAVVSKLSAQATHLLGMRISEVVSVITDQKFRCNGIGRSGLIAQFEKELARSGGNAIVYATTSNPKSARAFMSTNRHSNGLWNVQPVSFHDFPYFAGLTCIYSARGFDEEHICRLFRRSLLQSSPDALLQSTASAEHDYMPCTLLVSDVEKAHIFQERCRMLDEFPVRTLGSELSDDNILQVGRFFDRINTP